MTLSKRWIRTDLRLAIYLRDGLACAYCGATIEDRAELTLDHLKCHSRGGGNGAENLITCCKRCNSSRHTRAVRTFCRAVAVYRNVSWQSVENYVRRQQRRSIKRYRVEAQALLKRRNQTFLKIIKKCSCNISSSL